MGQFCYCSLSPQGDDNLPSNIFAMLSPHCSLSPQGDDNLSDLNGSYKMAIAAYPRKGTIILFIDGKLYDGFIAAYPRKGTIARTGCCCSNLLHIAAYPRKGTITSHQSARRTTCTDYSLSPQGDDNLIILLSIMLLLNCSLSPQGGKKLRIKKRCGVFLLQTLTLCFPWAVPL